MQRLRIVCAALVLFLALSACALSRLPAAEAGHGIELTGMDSSVKPFEDFYQFANGKWMARTPIPADRPMIGTAVTLRDHNRDVLHKILDEAAKDTTAAPDGVVGKVGAFYRSGMDEARVEAAGVKPLQAEFERIGQVADAASVLKELAHLHNQGVDVLFRLGPVPDFKSSTRMIAGVNQGGLGMPDRDYYLKTDEKTRAIRAAYLAHVEKMFSLLGETAQQASAHARAVLDFETRLAKASKQRVALRDPYGNYHLLARAEMEALTPGISWKHYFEDAGLGDLQELNVGQPDFLKEVGALLVSAAPEEWRTYLRWHLLTTYADTLSKPFVMEDFHFGSTVLSGVDQIRPRWERVQAMTDRLLGELLGQLYVARAFPPDAKLKAEALVNNLKAALHDRLETLDWMSPQTRRQALKKLAAMEVKIGYPSKWRDYSGLTIDDDVYVLNVMKAQTFLRKQQLAKIGKPVDRSEWYMTPPTVNAYYNPLQNEIVFPAGILQPPFFDAQADDACNYGAIGGVIGHEMTHGFDDQGRQFDSQGNLRNWWTAQDERTFKDRAALIARQYDGYAPIDNLHINGQLTLGENIADLGGLKIAYLAFQKAQQGKPAVGKIDDFTPEQRFFIAYAQVWRTKRRPEALRLMLATDPHSPPTFRVLGPLYNTPEFFQAFKVTPEQAARFENPKPVQIW